METFNAPVFPCPVKEKNNNIVDFSKQELSTIYIYIHTYIHICTPPVILGCNLVFFVVSNSLFQIR